MDTGVRRYDEKANTQNESLSVHFGSYLVAALRRWALCDLGGESSVCYRWYWRGSKTSRSPSPSRLKPKMISEMVSPGKKAAIGWS